jgi:hypothetical protein
VQNTDRLWRKLRLSYNAEIGDESARLIARSGCLAGLRHLDLTGCNLTPWGIKELMWSSQLAELRSLRVGNAGCDERCWQVLATCPGHPRLRELCILADNYQPDELVRFANSDRFPALQRLRLFGTSSLTDDGLAALADTPLMDRLVLLQVLTTGITAEGVQRLLAAPRTENLQVLHAAWFEMEDRRQLHARFFAQDHLAEV